MRRVTSLYPTQIGQQAADKLHAWWVAYWSDNLYAEDLACDLKIAAAVALGSDPALVECPEEHTLSFYLGIYALLAVGLGVASSGRYIGFALMGIRSSSSMHGAMFANVLRAPMSW